MAHRITDTDGSHYAFHYKNSNHEFEASKFGIWVFLCTEILMFGGLFVGYIINSGKYPEVFEVGATFLDWKLGFLNTVILLFSSFTIALSIRNIQIGEQKKAFNNLLVTVLCGFAFMGVKGYEYSHKYHLGLLPGKFFNYTPHHAEGDSHASGDTHNAHDKSNASESSHVSELPKNMPMYFSFYFVMTGIHGTHVIIGMCLIIWAMIRLKRGDFDPKHYTFVEGAALFWHLVDLVWIYLFPLLYLV